MSEKWECWVAYYGDYSGITVFATEIEALRYAVEKQMLVSRYDSGGEIR